MQRLKGNPGKRLRKRDTDVTDRAAKLASAPHDKKNVLSPPDFIEDKNLKRAREIWIGLVPDLHRIHLLSALDRHIFAAYCVRMAEWIDATVILAKEGHTYIAKNVNGDDLHRLHPMVKVRELAERSVLEMAGRYGLDPASRFKLLRDQAAAPPPGLFDQASTPRQDDAGDDRQPETNPVGLMERLSSPPPGSLPN